MSLGDVLHITFKQCSYTIVHMSCMTWYMTVFHLRKGEKFRQNSAEQNHKDTPSLFIRLTAFNFICAYNIDIINKLVLNQRPYCTLTETLI